jgi:hypothetical protein
VFDVLATVFLLPLPVGLMERFYLLVHEMRPSETPLQMVRATHTEVDAARRTLASLACRGKSVFAHVLTSLVHGLDIQGLERAPELRDSLEAVVVQAFSEGWIHNTSGKVHTLIIGAPAVGKKLLTDAARVLNPVFQEAHPSKATVAGVCSTAVQQDRLWRSKPGYVPLAHRGVFAIQDFHAVRDAQRERLLGVFNMVMEDGRVIDATAARQTHPALTSIHLDTNKRTDLFPGSQLRGETIVAKRLDDIRIPMTILSRFDFIIDIPRDTQRQIEIALAMYERLGGIVGPPRVASATPDWARALQVLVAWLRTEHERIVFPEALQRYMQHKHQDLSRANEGLIEQLPWLSDFQTRLSNSVYKLTAASARMNGRPTPLVEDVDRAFRLIGRKFDFLTTLSKHLQVPTSWQVPERADLTSWLQSRFAGQQVSTGAILEAYQHEFGVPLVRRTVERHLPQVARRVRHGRWAFPAGA